jgi:hypothetical protein
VTAHASLTDRIAAIIPAASVHLDQDPSTHRLEQIPGPGGEEGGLNRYRVRRLLSMRNQRWLLATP